jgi:hypothetical protein
MLATFISGSIIGLLVSKKINSRPRIVENSEDFAHWLSCFENENDNFDISNTTPILPKTREHCTFSPSGFKTKPFKK